jgi:hypothetical protein
MNNTRLVSSLAAAATLACSSAAAQSLLADAGFGAGIVAIHAGHPAPPWGWNPSAAPAVANIGSATLTSTNSTSAVLTFSHSGFEARPFPFGVAQTHKYRVCWRQLNQVGLACMYQAVNTSVQQVELSGLTVGLPINITIQCYCGRERNHGLSGPFGGRVVVNMNYTHQLPPPVPGLTGSTNVRVRGIQSGQCLFVDTSASLVRGWSCWADPAMVFALETFSDGSKRLRHVQSGLCITAGPMSHVRAQPCGHNGAKLAVMPPSGPGGPVLVRFLFTMGGIGGGQTGPSCLKANGANGSTATRQNCGAGPALSLMLDPV